MGFLGSEDREWKRWESCMVFQDLSSPFFLSYSSPSQQLMNCIETGGLTPCSSFFLFSFRRRLQGCDDAMNLRRNIGTFSNGGSNMVQWRTKENVYMVVVDW